MGNESIRPAPRWVCEVLLALRLPVRRLAPPIYQTSTEARLSTNATTPHSYCRRGSGPRPSTPHPVLIESEMRCSWLGGAADGSHML